MGAADDDPGKRMLSSCLNIAVQINKNFLLLTQCLQTLLLPQLSKYQYRTYLIYVLQVVSSDYFQLLLAKCMQTYYHVNNLLLLCSMGAFLPFMKVVYNLWTFIPCPAMASFISNITLVMTLGTLLALATGSSQGNLFRVYVTVVAVWPWLVLTSMVSRLFIERQAGKNPFSPINDLPLLGFMGSGAWVLCFMALKNLTISDCLVLMMFDNFSAACVASAFLGRQRRTRHFKAMKVYAMVAALALAYFMGDIGISSMAFSEPINMSHVLFLAGRFFFIVRSIYVKWKYGSFHRSQETKKPPENMLLFYQNNRPNLHRFRGFPSPMLLILDCLFDSGLRDTELHGMGPLGTEDLYNLTENSYLLPVATLSCWVQEGSTLDLGISPATDDTLPTAVSLASNALDAALAEGAATVQATGGAALVMEAPGDYDAMICLALTVLFCISRLLVPTAMAKTLFDRASPLHNWKYQPMIVAAPVFFYDILMLNSYISKFQVCMMLLLAALNAVYRNDMWNAFKKKYLLLQTQDLHYQSPSTVRQLQRKTLLQFLERTSTDDYGTILLETAIGHGSNIRELARDMSIQIWDPAPSSTAAWKLAFSLVTKSLRRQKLLRKNRLDTKSEVHKFIEGIVHGMVDKAVDTAAGHGARIKIAGSLAAVTAKRRAVRKLRDLAVKRRQLRAARKAGQLSSNPAQLATAGGTLRSVRELKDEMVGTMRSTIGGGPTPQLALPGASGMPRIQAPPTAQSTMGSTGFAGAMMSLTSQDQSFEGEGSFESAGSANRMSVPGEVGQEQLSGLMDSTFMSSQGALEADLSDSGRGVWNEHYSMAGPPPDGQLLIVAFGDTKRGQLGVEPQAGARQIARTVNLVVEELRGQQPVQIEAAGVASYVVGMKGQVWAFGSNRSMELGSRKEVAQISSAQRVKSIRSVHCVQIVGSNSASGQAHTLALGANGEVHTFGASPVGALGQGADVRQSAPLLLRFSSQMKVRFIAAGARHSILITDAGKMFTMGDNAHGQLGLEGKRELMVDTPCPVGGDLGEEEVRVKLAAAGDDHTLAVTEDDKLYSWGGNANGQLALGKLTDQPLPQEVKQLTGLGIGAIACGARHSLAITSGGMKTWAWGSNVHGQLGVGQNSPSEGYQRTLPTLISALSTKKGLVVVQVTAASSHSLALMGSGEVYAFGHNSHGQLGFPTGKSADAAGSSDPTTKSQFQQLQQQAQKERAKARNKVEMDMPKLHDNGVEILWLPVRVVTLSQYRIRQIATADMHTLTIAQHHYS